MAMTPVTVIRSQWHRGKGGIGSRLTTYASREGGSKHCCLGFVALAAGVPEDGTRCAYPSGITNAKEYPLLRPFILNPSSSVVGVSNLCRTMTQINDDDIISDSVREEKLTQWARHANIELTFVD